MFKARCTLSALLVGFAISSSVHALGLGPVEIQSHLGEPLTATIPVYGVTPTQMFEVKARLGSRAEFARVGLEYHAELNSVRMQLVSINDRVYLQLSSLSPMREPLLNLALVAEQQGISYLREYALLLDLPGTPLSVSTPIQAALEPAPANAEPQASASAPSVNNAVTVYGPTQNGDSLSTVAIKLAKSSNVNWQTMAVAIYQKNPSAFINGDVNKLLSAVSLNIPNISDLNAVSQGEWARLIASPSDARVPAPTVVASAGPSSSTLSSSTPSSTLSSTQASPAPTPVMPTVSATPSVQLQVLIQENAELKSQIAESEARLAALEAKIVALPDVTTTQPIADALSSESSLASPTVVAVNASNPQPEVIIREPVSAPSNVVATADETSTAAVETVVGWRDVFWYLTAILGLAGLGALIWHWREKVNLQRQLLMQRVRYSRELKNNLPLPITKEGSKEAIAEASKADKRMLKFQQVQAAVETYLSYKRYDRAEELLQQEISLAQDDLILRRQFTRMLKSLEHQKATEAVIESEQKSAFDDATLRGTAVSMVSKDQQRSGGA